MGEDGMAEGSGLAVARPMHPGRFVRTMVLEPLGLSVSRAAVVLGVSRVALSRLLNEKAALSPDMAIRLDKAFGADMETLLKMQADRDIAEARARAPEIDVAPYDGGRSAA
jgi:addiction module HigA family antidote